MKGLEKSRVEREKEKIKKFRELWVEMKVSYVQSCYEKGKDFNDPEVESKILRMEEFVKELVQREEGLNSIGENSEIPKSIGRAQKLLEELTKKEEEMKAANEIRKSERKINNCLEGLVKDEN